ncbi:Uncharacterised protein [Yokenella regensburgei]|nr:Uncharacterised protein [Yokenella regensburgei]
MPSATGIENTMVGPIIAPRISPEYSHAATSPPASSFARKKPPISHASSVPANIDGLAPSISYSGIITGPSSMANTGANAVIPTIASPSAPIAINPSSNCPPDPSILLPNLPRKRAEPPNCDRILSMAAISIKNIMMYMMISLIPIAFPPFHRNDNVIVPPHTARQSAPAWRFVGCFLYRYPPARLAPRRGSAQESRRNRSAVLSVLPPRCIHLPPR